MTDWLDIVDAAYDVQEPSHQNWLRGLMAAVGVKMGNAQGVIGALFHFPRGGSLQLLPHRLAQDGFFEAGQEFTHNAQELTRTLYSSSPFATASMLVGREALSRSLPAAFQAMGVRDMLGLVARDPGAWGTSLVVPLGKPQRVSAARAAPWARIAAHIHAGLRIRFGIHGEPALPSVPSLVKMYDGIDAVLTDSGKLEHAEPSALAGRELLREAARAITRARTHTRRRDADDALNEWQSLIDGKWTLIDHFDTDGRRFLVARRNAPGGDRHTALSPDEARAAGFRAMGHSLKLIGYELGFSVPTVSRLLRNAARKLGLQSSQEFVHFAGESGHAPAALKRES
jgi:DNA-binding CsgD family transcriptional regulator